MADAFEKSMWKDIKVADNVSTSSGSASVRYVEVISSDTGSTGPSLEVVSRPPSPAHTVVHVGSSSSGTPPPFFVPARVAFQSVLGLEMRRTHARLRFPLGNGPSSRTRSRTVEQRRDNQYREGDRAAYEELLRNPPRSENPSPHTSESNETS